MLSERIKRLRDRQRSTTPTICLDRARLVTKYYQGVATEPNTLRRAKFFKYFLENRSIFIDPDSILAGHMASRLVGCPVFVDVLSWLSDEIDTADTRPYDPYQFLPGEKDELKALAAQWKGHTFGDFTKAQIDEESALMEELGVFTIGSREKDTGSNAPDYYNLINRGYRWYIDECKAKIAAQTETDIEALNRKNNWESFIIVMEALIDHAHRYANFAEKMAAECDNEERRQELRTMAENCRVVPEFAPKTFHQGVQLVWFTHLAFMLEGNGHNHCLGRFDQYMDPYYEADLAKGAITPEAAQELIDALWLKYSEWVWTISSNTADYFAGYNQFQNLTVGGKKRDGSDGTNPITYMALQATEEVKTHQPGLSVRVQADCPKEFLDAVCHLVSKGTGFPAIHSDAVGYQMLLNAGYEPDDARDWNNCGCVVPHFRKTGEWTAAVNMNFGSALEYALNQGKSLMTGEQMGLEEKPAAEMTSYEDVKAAFYKQFDNLCRHSIILTIEAQRLHKEMVPRPFLSSCIEHCMESGKDLSQGGAKYNVGPVITGIGLAVVANSLAAVKKLVFEDKVCDMATLAKALQANWEGYDELRAQAQACPKYGNDDRYVDNIAIEIANHYYHEIHQYKDIFGSPFNTAFMGISNYIPMGRVLGATPCGRKNGEPSSEGVSPFVGTDTSTPLAAMRSAAKLNQEIHSGGTLLNLRLDHNLVATKRGQANLGAMIQTLFSLGAFHVQFNCISSDVLRDAQLHPENYKDLLVRVAGYSTQFVNLSKSMQDAIIARTEHAAF